MEEKQVIYINMDDSGRLINTEKDEISFVYGGIFFTSLETKNDFSRQYKTLVNKIKPKYCRGFNSDSTIIDSYCFKHNSNNCKYNCPELKSSMLESHHRRRLLNLIKKYDTSVIVVNNTRANPDIYRDKYSKARYKDYIIKREIKEILKYLISQSRLDPSKPVKLVIALDEQPTVTDGPYNLRDVLKEELQYGYINYDYGSLTPPMLSEVDVNLSYKNSYYNILIQASDLLVGEVRHRYYQYNIDKNIDLYRNKINFIKTITYLS